MVVTAFRLDRLDDEGSDRGAPFFDCLFDEFEYPFFFAAVDADVFIERILQLRERDVRPIEARDCRLAGMIGGRLSIL